jgi:hypothetical protein
MNITHHLKKRCSLFFKVFYYSDYIQKKKVRFMILECFVNECSRYLS